MKIEKEEEEGGEPLWSTYGLRDYSLAVCKEGRKEGRRMRIGLGHSLSFHAGAAALVATFPFEATARIYSGTIEQCERDKVA